MNRTTEPTDERTPPALANALAATAIGTWMLLAVGGTAAVTDAAAACPTWPTCGGRWLAGAFTPAVAVALAHRLAALVVGTALLVVAVRVRAASRRVRWTVYAALALYPVQVVVGAFTLRGARVAPIHLVLGMSIFASLVLALTWQLAAERDGATDGVDDGSDVADEATADDAPAEPDFPAAPTRRERAWAYVRMTKPRLNWLLCLVALAAMFLAGGKAVAPARIGATLLGGVLAVGASGVFNNVFERDVDREMARTNDRPLVGGLVPVRNAAAFGLALTVASVAVFLTWVNAVAAALGVSAILAYSVGYTLVLKPNTDQNIVIGGAVGAFPALIGWAAVTGTIGLPVLVLSAVVFLWTPAHFYNLALVYRDDYARAGFPMMPVVRGEATTYRHILLYLGATMVATVALGWLTDLGWLYAATVLTFGAVFLGAVVHLHREGTDAAAMRTFHAANAYLGGLLLAVVVDSGLV